MHHPAMITRATRTTVVAIVTGFAVLVIGMVIVRDGTVPAPERRVFEAVNGLPQALYSAVWPFQQLGALVVGPVVAIVAVVMHRHRLAIAALVVTMLKLAAERGVK
ncbi:MAG: hypothetical protein H0U21_13790, partial [Acidimicrobiia bacterium]|nr:hypothetical protein [Acidimicrobiia bacterium]